MWALLKSILVKFALLKALLRALGSLGWLLPLALLLKAVGLPFLLLLAVLALPLIIVLAVLGLPIILVVVVGGALLTFTLWIVSMGLMALKIALPIILVVWVIRWFMKRDDTPPAPATPEPDTGTT